MKLLTYLHATLVAMLVLPLLYAIAELQDADGEGMLYLKCLLIFITIMVTEIAVRRQRSPLFDCDNSRKPVCRLNPLSGTIKAGKTAAGGRPLRGACH